MSPVTGIEATPLFKFTLLIPPCIKKNGMNIAINKRTNVPFLLPNKKYRENTKEAVFLLKKAWNGRPVITCKIQAKFTFYYSGKHPDLSNLYESIQDWLGTKHNGAGVIEDDTLIQSHDGSRKIHLCTGCPWYNEETGKRLKSKKHEARCPDVGKCPKVIPRMEIELYEFTEAKVSMKKTGMLPLGGL